jgi:hypothetical protein
MNTSNVRALTKPACDPDIIKYLEASLERAKAGELLGILLLEEDATGIGYKTAGINDRYKTSGFLFHALHKLQDIR